MSDLRELYQEVILDHYRAPRNFRRMDGQGCRSAEGNNPLCGDEVEVAIKVEDGVVTDVAFQGTGCAISLASASIMTETLKGKTEGDILDLFRSFQAMVTGTATDGPTETLGKLAVFEGVRAFPSRVKCAVLAWHTLKAALQDNGKIITTE